MLRKALLAITALVTLPVLGQQADAPTLRTGIKLVVVDVTVTDSQHRSVRGLKASDFTLLENKASQQVKNFEEHVPPTPQELQKIPPMPPISPGVFTNFTPAPSLVANGPVNVLLIDRMNTPTQAQGRLRAQLVDYLKKAKPGSRTAIFGLNSQLVLLQGFTTNPEILRNAIEHKNNVRASALLEPATATGGAPGTQMSDRIDTLMEATGDPNQGAQLAMLKAYSLLFESQQAAHAQMDRSRRTLDAMNALARYLVNIPGRKNLIWFSGSFPIDIVPDPKLASSGGFDAEFMNVADVVAEYRETLSLLSRAQVVMYPVDARGVTVLPNTSVAGEGGLGDKYVINGINSVAADLNSAMENTFTENTTMRDLAYQTGGRAFLNSNDLAGSMEDALADGSSYYSLAYTPSNGDWKGDFRKIEVKLRQSGYTLNYRRGYYADDPLAPPSKWDKLGSGRAVTTSLEKPDFGAMHLALLHAGPEPADIVLKANVLPTSTAEEMTLAEANAGRSDLKGPYRRYSIDLSVEAHTLNLAASPDGLHHGSMEFVTLVYDEYGNAVNGIQSGVQADLKPEVYERVLKAGLPIHQEVSVPVKGEYFLRIAAHDLKSGHVGAVEVPVASVRRLQPALPPMKIAEEPPPAPVPAPATAPVVAAVVAPTVVPPTVVQPTAKAPAQPVSPEPETPYVPAPADAALDKILVRVHQNFESYIASVPNLLANERVGSSMTIREQHESHSSNAITESVFRLERTKAGNRSSRLRESREVRTVNNQAVADDSAVHGPVVLQGAFGYGASFFSTALKHCYDYRLHRNQKLHGSEVIVIDYSSKPKALSTSGCPVSEVHNGRAFLDPKTFEIVRVEQKRPRHEIDPGTYTGAGVKSKDQNGGSLQDLSFYQQLANQVVRIQPGTIGVWSWVIDYAPVTLDHKVFWLPKTIQSTTSAKNEASVQWNFNADYDNYNLLLVNSRILSVSPE